MAGGVENLDKHRAATQFDSKTGSEAGKKSAKARSEKRKMLDAIDYLMKMAPTKNVRGVLGELGYTDELTNADALVANLFAMAMKGNLKAAELLMNYRIQMEENERKNKESAARIEAIKKNDGDITVSSGEGEGDVIIYLPEIEKEEEVQNKEG